MLGFRKKRETDCHPILSRILAHFRLRVAPDFNDADSIIKIDLSKEVISFDFE